MKTFDPSSMIVAYNFVIGVLIMLSSEKLASTTGRLLRARTDRLARFTYLTAFTFGSCTAVLSAAIYLTLHFLKIEI